MDRRSEMEEEENTHPNLLSKPWCSFVSKQLILNGMCVVRARSARWCLVQVKSWHCVSHTHMHAQTTHISTYRHIGDTRIYTPASQHQSVGLKVEICRRFNVMMMITIASCELVFFISLSFPSRTWILFIFEKRVQHQFLAPVGFDTGK